MENLIDWRDGERRYMWLQGGSVTNGFYRLPSAALVHESEMQLRDKASVSLFSLNVAEHHALWHFQMSQPLVWGRGSAMEVGASVIDIFVWCVCRNEKKVGELPLAASLCVKSLILLSFISSGGSVWELHRVSNVSPENTWVSGTAAHLHFANKNHILLLFLLF